MKVNGEEKKLTGAITLVDFLQQEGYDPRRIAVERNGQIVPRSTYAGVELADADTLEIVHFVGGG